MIYIYEYDTHAIEQKLIPRSTKVITGIFISIFIRNSVGCHLPYKDNDYGHMNLKGCGHG